MEIIKTRVLKTEKQEVIEENNSFSLSNIKITFN